MPSVGHHRELDPVGAAVGEERFDRRPNRAPGVEDVVDEDAGAAFERKVEPGGADERLRMEWRLTAAHVDVVAVERDVDGAEGNLDAAELLDRSPEPLRERHTARVDTDERDPVQIGVPLDDLVRDPRQRARERVRVEDDARGRDVDAAQRTYRFERELRAD